MVVCATPDPPVDIFDAGQASEAMRLGSDRADPDVAPVRRLWAP
jgi:hypothetical protein